MPGRMTRTRSLPDQGVSSAELTAALTTSNFSDATATVIGYGHMGQEYVKALRALRVKRIRVCSRSAAPLEACRGMEGVETAAGGMERFEGRPEPGELAIIATPMALLLAATERCVALGFRQLLIEKPVSLYSKEIERLASRLEQHGVEAVCAYNRVAYPSFHEVNTRAVREGGVTSCTYTFTERIKSDWPIRFSPEELARWGVANSLHVMSLAHGLIGWPSRWNGHRSGSISWHPSGAVFVGSGRSDRGIPFAYHADWGSTGRWSVEVHTAGSSYRLCPLERLFQRRASTADWEEIPVSTFAPHVKAGLTELVAAMWHEGLRDVLPLVSLRDAAALTRYGESVFGYDADTRR